MTNNNFNELDLSIRSLNCLSNAGFTNIPELKSYIENNGIYGLIKFRGFGFMSAREIKEALVEHKYLPK